MERLRHRSSPEAVLALMATLACALAVIPSEAWGQNPVPWIDQPLVPAGAIPGGASFTLTVNGAGFVSGAVVDWNGHARPTTFVSSTQLTTSINANAIEHPGSNFVTVVNPAPGGGTSNVAFFQVTPSASQVAFSGSSAATGSSPISVAVADFNGNGKLDLAVANDASNSVSILLGKGDGIFQSHVDYATGLGPQAVTVGDFSGNGKLDLALADSGENSSGQLANTVSILLGNGDGTFQTYVDYATGSMPVSVVTADFNRDGNLDLAVANEMSDSVSILLGNGDGTFQSHVDYAVADQPISLVTSDFNGDGILDLAVANFGSNTVSVLLGNGDGTFQAAVDYSAPSDPVSLVAADFNGDGNQDLAVAEFLTSTVSVLLGNGDGTFQAAVAYSTGSLPESIATGDFDGDGILDLAVTNDNSSGSVAIMLGAGNGTFGSATEFPAGLLPVSIATGDFNQDGKLDVVTANLNGNSVSPLLQTTLLLSPATLTFASQNLGTTSAAQTVTLTNIGTGSLSITSLATASPFAETNTCGTSLQAGASCTASVTFTPTTPGTSNGSLSVTDGAVGSPQVVSLSGTGTGPAVGLSPTSLNFGSVNVGSRSSIQTITLSNTGNESLTIDSITVSANYVETSTTCGSTLAAGASCDIDIGFEPSSAGTLPGTVTITDNALNSPQFVSLTGIGLAPQVTLSVSSLTFATQVVNTTSPAQNVTLTNTGTESLSITNISTSAAFPETNTCGSTVGIGASCTISVSFAPTGQGTQNGTVLIYDNASGSPQKITCTGTGTVVSLSPTSLNFGTITVGTTSSPQTVTLTNVGTSALNINSVTITGTNPGDFAQTNTCGKFVSAGGSCSLSVTFTPTATGSRSASLSISDGAGGSPQTVSLSGTGD